MTLNNLIKFYYPKERVPITIRAKRDQKLIPFFFDFTAPTSRKGISGESGTGFGLPLVKIFVDMYNAKIEVKSSEESDNSGTSVTIYFPIKRGQHV